MKTTTKFPLINCIYIYINIEMYELNENEIKYHHQHKYGIAQR